MLDKWQLLDHVAIYALIAGSYTPLVLLVLVKRKIAPRVGAVILVLIWLMAGTIDDWVATLKHLLECENFGEID